jgi:hypothetical protein
LADKGSVVENVGTTSSVVQNVEIVKPAKRKPIVFDLESSDDDTATGKDMVSMQLNVLLTLLTLWTNTQ